MVLLNDSYNVLVPSIISTFLNIAAAVKVESVVWNEGIVDMSS